MLENSWIQITPSLALPSGADPNLKVNTSSPGSDVPYTADYAKCKWDHGSPPATTIQAKGPFHQSPATEKQ